VRGVVDLDDRGGGIDEAPSAAEDCAVICYTSGTTGHPKGARLTHANFRSNLEAFGSLRLLEVTADDVLLGLLPFFHIFGLNVILNTAARQAATVLAVQRFSPTGTLEALAEHRVTIAYGAPPVFGAWTAVPPELVPRLPALRAAVSGADALPVRTWQRFAEGFGVEIMEGYGLTETAPVLTSNAASPAVRPGTVGHPLPGVRLRVVDPLRRDLGTDEVGEILASGPNVFEGYHEAPEATAEVLQDGWFATGDLGAVDASGYLRIAGRLKDMVIVSGFNVYPREVEDALRSHPGVAEAAVLGVPDERTGERVVAFVVPLGGADPDADAVLDHCRERLARYKIPREIRFVPDLPRVSTGKVSRQLLLERARG
jgi:long-chain acyl-CoA synthetase